MRKCELRPSSTSKLSIAVGLALSAGAASGQTAIPVTSAADTGPGTLRQAFIDADASAGPDSIDMSAISGSTITLAADLPEVAGDLQISGSDVTLDGNGQACLRVTGYLEVADMTITNCNNPESSPYVGGRGGAISANGLFLENSTITGNTAGRSGGGVFSGGYSANIVDSVISNNSARFGGGVRAVYSLAIIDSTITGNSAETDGGGFFVSAGYGSEFTMENSSITGNTAGRDGGGGYAYSGPDRYGISIVNSTISSNSAGREGGGLKLSSRNTLIADVEIGLTNSTVTTNTAATGGGIFSYNGSRYDVDVTFSIIGGTIAFNESTASEGGGVHVVNEADPDVSYMFFNIDNSIIQGNIAPGSGADVAAGAPTTPGSTNLTFNVNYTVLGEAPVGPAVFNPDGATSGAIGSDAELGPLADNGGPTLTHLPGVGSLAREFIPDGVNGCGATFDRDQRGESRPLGPACDAGSVEQRLSLPPVVPVPTMTRWGAGVLGLGLALMGWLGFRRRTMAARE